MVFDFKSEDDFETWLVAEYFKFGSIDQVLKFHQYNIPISYAGYHRVLNKFGIVKSAGPNSKLSESLYLLSLIANYKTPLEKVYRKYAPASVKVSSNTLHRILHCTRLGLTRRQGVALLIENKLESGKYLVANDMSLTHTDLGSKGDLSLPMSHSKVGENPRVSIMRVLQQEVFSNSVLNKNFPVNIIPEHPKPAMYINIADIRVSVYTLQIHPEFSFSSFKLRNHTFKDIQEIRALPVRPGVCEIINAYEQNRNTNQDFVPEIDSNLNTSLLAYAKIGSN